MAKVKEGKADAKETAAAIQEISLDKIDVRPGDFQARETSGSKSYNEELVAGLVARYDRSKLDPIEIYPDPEQPGRYVLTAGHHRLETVRRVGESSIPARVADVDASDPEALQKLRQEAVLSNFRGGRSSVRELVNTVGILQETGMDSKEISERMRTHTRPEIERLLDLHRLGPSAVDRINAQPELQKVGEELGSAIRRYPDRFNQENTHGLLLQFAKELDETGQVRGQAALRQRLRDLAQSQAPAAEEGRLPGFSSDAVLTQVFSDLHDLEEVNRELTKLRNDRNACSRLAETTGVDIEKVQAYAERELVKLEAQRDAMRDRYSGSPSNPAASETAEEPGSLQAATVAPAAMAPPADRDQVNLFGEVAMPPPESGPDEPEATADAGAPTVFARQSTLGNEFATNQTQAMEMPSFEAGAEAERMHLPAAFGADQPSEAGSRATSYLSEDEVDALTTAGPGAGPGVSRETVATNETAVAADASPESTDSRATRHVKPSAIDRPGHYPELMNPTGKDTAPYPSLPELQVGKEIQEQKQAKEKKAAAVAKGQETRRKNQEKERLQNSRYDLSPTEPMHGPLPGELERQDHKADSAVGAAAEPGVSQGTPADGPGPESPESPESTDETLYQGHKGPGIGHLKPDMPERRDGDGDTVVVERKPRKSDDFEPSPLAPAEPTRRSKYQRAREIVGAARAAGGATASTAGRFSQSSLERGRAIAQAAGRQVDEHAPETKAALLEKAKQFTGEKKGSCQAEPKSLDARLAEVIKGQAAPSATQKNASKGGRRRSSSRVSDKDLKKVGGRGRVIIIRD